MDHFKFAIACVIAFGVLFFLYCAIFYFGTMAIAVFARWYGSMKLHQWLAEHSAWPVIGGPLERLVVWASVPVLTSIEAVNDLAGWFEKSTGKMHLARMYVRLRGISTPEEFKTLIELVPQTAECQALVTMIWQAGEPVMSVQGNEDRSYLEQRCKSLTNHRLVRKQMEILVEDICDAVLPFFTSAKEIDAFTQQHMPLAWASVALRVAFAMSATHQTLQDKVLLLARVSHLHDDSTNAIIGILETAIPLLYDPAQDDFEGVCNVAGFMTHQASNGALSDFEMAVVTAGMRLVTDVVRAVYFCGRLPLKSACHAFLTEYVKTQGVRTAAEAKLLVDCVRSSQFGGADAVEAIIEAMLAAGVSPIAQEFCMSYWTREIQREQEKRLQEMMNLVFGRISSRTQ